MESKYIYYHNNDDGEYTPPKRDIPPTHRRRRRRRSKFYTPSLWLLWFPLTIFYSEVMLRVFTGMPVFFGILGLLFFSLSLGFFLDIFCFMLSSDKAKEVIRFTVSIILAVLFSLQYFMFNTYRVFMDLKSIITGAGGVAGEFQDVVISAIISGLPKIFMFLLPTIVLLILKLLGHEMNITPRKRKKFNGGGTLVVVIFSLVSFGLAMLCTVCVPALRESYFEWHGFDGTVPNLGLMTAERLDVKNSIFGSDTDEGEFVIDESGKDDEKTDPGKEIGGETPEGGEQDPTVVTPVVPKVYGDNVMDYDFESLIASSPGKDVTNLHNYVSSLTPSKQNDYTGLFKGKNLIFFCAEAFSAEVIDKDLTPTLYRLANNGFKFTDYYQPAWGGSTSTGEYSLLSGLVPTSGVKSMKATIGKDLSFTIGNKLQKENYFTAAFHNGQYDYYSRNKTHVNFGYSTFTGMGNGMENGVTKRWPESDLEMMQYTLPQYATGDKPFCVYYMTVSGHCLYYRSGNNMTKKNWDAAASVQGSEAVRGYMAANLELEYALQYTVQYLEEHNLADDTVIVLGADHYPYGLEKSDSWGNDQDYLAELYGYPADNNMARDHSALIIWSGCLEHENKDMAISIDTPTYSLDVLPTLCNLFGVEYDSRLLVGRDVFSDTSALVMWGNKSWKTEKGYYNSADGSFTPAADAGEVSDDYISSVKNAVKNKFTFSSNSISTDYFRILDNSR